MLHNLVQQVEPGDVVVIQYQPPGSYLLSNISNKSRYKLGTSSTTTMASKYISSFFVLSSSIHPPVNMKINCFIDIMGTFSFISTREISCLSLTKLVKYEDFINSHVLNLM